MRLRILLLAALLVGGFVYFTGHPNQLWQRVFPSSVPLWSEPAVAHSAGLGSDELNSIEVYKAAHESVVYVTSTVYRRTFFYDVPQRDLGSGFLVNAEGQILTNFHVISGSSEVEVTLPDQTKHKARVLVRDRTDDLALIKIDVRKNLPHLNLGDSDRLQVGQKVLAIGNPFGLSGTLTTGIVSSLGREIQGEDNQPLEGMIQTDAAINSGNSGGPLLDSQGNVIGINTAIYGPNGGNVGIGFAIPINRVKTMLDDYRAGRSFKRPRLGVNEYFIPGGELATALHLPASGGLLIQEVASRTAAEAAGLRGYRDVVAIGNERVGIGGDLITAIDGKPVTQEDALTRALLHKRPGDEIELTIFRNGRTMNLKVKLGEAPDGPL
jgi:S1-C subfamily serine protease